LAGKSATLYLHISGKFFEKKSFLISDELQLFVRKNKRTVEKAKLNGNIGLFDDSIFKVISKRRR
jgi:hypothetical protein